MRMEWDTSKAHRAADTSCTGRPLPPAPCLVLSCDRAHPHELL